MYQLLYKESLPFKIGDLKGLLRELKKFKSLKLPPEERKLISDECFDLLNQLLVTDPEKRIDFDQYFKHKFFSEEHKKELIKKYSNPNNDKNKNIEIVEIKRITLKLEEFEEKFLKLRLLKDYNGLKIYKGKDRTNNEFVYIKEMKRDIIDSNKENKNIFDKEIKLLSLLKGPNFPKCFGIYETKSFYLIIYEYYHGNILEDFICKRKGLLNESLKKSMMMQLEPSFLELKKKNIILKNISSKSLVFSYYQNENNFMIKLFDFYINSIFFKEDDNSVNFKFEDFIRDSNDKNKENMSNENNLIGNLKPIIKDEYLEKLLEIIKNKIEIITNYFQDFFVDKNIVETERISNYYKEIIILLYFCLL
jgi:serine/threonine protein kinase